MHVLFFVLSDNHWVASFCPTSNSLSKLPVPQKKNHLEEMSHTVNLSLQYFFILITSAVFYPIHFPINSCKFSKEKMQEPRPE